MIFYVALSLSAVYIQGEANVSIKSDLGEG